MILENKADNIRLYAIFIIIFGLLAFLVLDKGGRPFYFIPFIMVSSCLLVFIYTNLSIDLKNKINYKDPVFLSLFLFLAASFVSAIFSVNKYVSYSYTFYLLSLILVFLVISGIYIVGHIKKILYFILGLALLESVISIYFLFISTGIFDTNKTRMVGTFYWPNPLAGFLLFGIPISLYLFWQSKKKRFFYLIPCSLILAVFVLTYSKGAYLSIIVPILILSYYYREIIKKEFLVKVLALVFLSAILVFGISEINKRTYSEDTYSANFVNTLDIKEEEMSSITRLAYYKGAFDISLDNKLIGTGANTFEYVYPQYQDSPVERSRFVHNYYLKVLSEMGIFGFLGFMSFVLGLAFIGFRLLKTKLRKVSLPFFAAVLGVLVHIGIDFDFSYPAIFFCFWIFAAILYGFCLKKQTKEEKKLNLVFVFVGFFILVKGVSLFFSSNNFDQAQICYSNREYEEAKNYYERSINLLNDDPQVYYNIGKVDYMLDQKDEAKENALKAVNLNPYISKNYYFLGKIYQKDEDYKEAESNFKKAIELDPINTPDYYIDLASLYLQNDQKEKARNTVDTILPLYSETVLGTLHLNKSLPLKIDKLKEIKEQVSN